VKTLKVVTRDGQVHVFEGDKDELATLRYRLSDMGHAPYLRLVNREGRVVTIYNGSIGSVK
jgi:hypothetical protein